nr:DNA topoisomerase IB [Pseudaestuariivita rosea]
MTYYPDDRPGIKRERRGKGFSYIAPDGTRIDRGAERDRLIALAVPPAYEQVWICPLENGHLQATGRDARQRKQYRYHPDWASFRDKLKFDGLADFGMSLPAIRRKISQGLQADIGSEELAIASVLALMDRYSLRVGNAQYAEENETFGATTLRADHLRKAVLKYRAKGGHLVEKQLDRRLARILGKVSDLPGAELCVWVDDAGQTHSVSSEKINDVIGSYGDDFTAKTFRTWNGSVAALEAANQDATLTSISEAAAAALHNTPTIARKSYIHPKVIDLVKAKTAPPEGEPKSGLRKAETQLLTLLS